MRLTSNQWNCLLAASRGDAGNFHGNTKMSLLAAGLLRWVGWEGGKSGYEPTAEGRHLLGAKFPTGQIGERW